ncbi:D-alanyl-D-alanine carboxypeptidase/D-alanyl-D-alanine-endopeptidase [Aquabacterium sp. CECT 9606]|uniref:D-alanyl-D-alanine carboxypeptidase/D-alanyl-D-alanine endopeptidase n=1 Tax=Aquabacterium sp. CECT 9606 TaxID=2845822 RepID=UPI001E5EA873|nr:D-alanyl-D-alanine carboxypeptidase/D-alanyl-D-alanine-endopeptidase [Aquabacterium sp. CECT 9606]CAH0347826.1 D-alanyl-D-alanine carboxypeptidase DacB [Aquabacterium sp. CECT 9606]
MTVTCPHPPSPPWFGTLVLALLLAPLGAACQPISKPALVANEAPPWPPALQQALQSAQLPADAVSMLVLPVDGGPARLSVDAASARNMASVMKLFTTGVALQTLGPAFTWHTQLALGGRLRPDGVLEGPLLMRGDGDPSLVIERVALMMTRLRAAGLRDIHGDWLLDRSAFAAVPVHDASAFDNQPLKPHNAGPDALLIGHQALTLRLRPDVANPGWATISMEPELRAVRLDAKVPLDDKAICRDWRESMSLQLRPDPPPGSGWTFTLKGRYPSACGERDWPLHWPGGEEQDHTERVLDTAWRRAGGLLQGQVQPGGAWPPETPAWFTWESPPLATVVRDINKFSNNVMARQLFLTLGRDAAPTESSPMGPASLEAARARVTTHVVQATWDPTTGTSPCGNGGLLMDNGSGLSRIEQASAACVGRWLQALWASPAMPDLLASLPMAGVDGTARKMISAAGRAHLKTGSLDGVAAVAGVALGDSGRRYVVVGVVNDAKADAARPLLRALVEWTVHDQ